VGSERSSSLVEAPSRHPEGLSRLDRPYLIPWGRAEIRRLASRAACIGATIAVVAWLSGSWHWLWLEIPLAVFLSVAVLFFRNPRRRPPREAGILVSPADGRVTDIEAVHEGEYLNGPALRIGIFLSIFSVHVNRSPGSGVVEYVKHRPGKFLDARDPRCKDDNESQSLGLRVLAGDGDGNGDGDEGLRVLVRQISGAIARRIVCEARVGDVLDRGGLYGMIKYGSRTELYVPYDQAPAWRAAVAVGDRVRGGSTVLFRRDAEPGGG
jgi:phosphatidylserine decarboxylase